MATIQTYPDNAVESQNCINYLRDPSNYSQLQDIANRTSKTLEIYLDDVLNVTKNYEFVENIKNNTYRYLTYFAEAADTLLPAANTIEDRRDVFDFLEEQRRAMFLTNNNGMENQFDPAQKVQIRRFEVQIVPPISDPARKLREIQSTEIGHLIKVKGMVVRTTDVKPHIMLCTYTCEVCGSEIFQHISTSQFMPYIKCPSQRCIDNKTSGRLVMANRGSVFSKYQELRVQELPDQVPVGHIPRSISIHCWGEQTRQCVPGDIVTISGIFLSTRVFGFKGMRNGLQTDTYVKACKIEKHKSGSHLLDESAEGVTDRDTLRMIQELAAEGESTYSHLAASIAPEIFGHEDVKKALLLQLVGADTKVLPDGMKIRGDINICLMGDPGVAKSQLLKYVAGISTRGVYTTGKGSSGVGLTAAVVRDEVSGEMTLEGGALVLADCGICCIDEFDKMDEVRYYIYYICYVLPYCSTVSI